MRNFVGNSFMEFYLSCYLYVTYEIKKGQANCLTP